MLAARRPFRRTLAAAVCACALLPAGAAQAAEVVPGEVVVKRHGQAATGPPVAVRPPYNIVRAPKLRNNSGK